MPGRTTDDGADDIAIVGMACRFPGARNYDEYWANLLEGRFSVIEVPEQRWRIDEHYSPDPDAKNKTVSKWGGFIDDADSFDAAFFKISPREAELMDPQQRILLELTWACMEDAGYAIEELRGTSAGVFIGACNFDYKEVLEKVHAPIEGHLSTGTYSTLIPNRISYEFDFKGPSICIDSACASSLVALHDAVYALRRGDCNVAFVGGVSVLCSPTYFIAFSKLGMLSPEGACKTFDESASGYVRGEGAGIVMLKPLRQALADGDRVYALVKATGVNHGGKVSTLTSPSPYAQSKLIIDAYQRHGVSPETVTYIEAHGTGTPKGDPIEIIGLKRAFSTLGKSFGVSLPPGTCGIGSAKTNIGHLESAAGIAGLIKVVLSLRHRHLPGLMHLKQVNSRVDFSESPFYLVDRNREWELPPAVATRRAGVSSFGFGGVNSHAVLEEYVAEPRPRAAVATALPLLLSAKNADRLRDYAGRLLRHLHAQPEEALALDSVLYSLSRRQAMEERAMGVVDSIAGLKSLLTALAGEGNGDGIALVRGNVLTAKEALAARNKDSGADAALARAIEASDFPAMAADWVIGVAIDWRAVFGVSAPPRVALPTYPFQKKRYWVAGPVRDTRTAAAEPTPMQTAAPVPSPVAVSTPAPAPVSAPADPAQIWEVHAEWHRQPIADSAEGTRSFAKRAVINCLPGISADALVPAAERALWVQVDSTDPGRDGAAWIGRYCNTIDALKQVLKQQPSDCVLLSSAGDRFASTLYAALQAIRKELGLPLQWLILGDDERRPDADEIKIDSDLRIAHARAALRCAARGSGASAVLRFPAVDACEALCWACSPFANVDHGASSKPPRFNQRGVYWITGGNGGLGRKIAALLAEKYDATVILSGRTPAEIAIRDSVIVAQGSGRVVYRMADCTDRAQMLAAYAWIVAEYGAPNGVIHAAGAIQDKSVFFKTRADIDKVIRPKIEGALLLDEATAACDLDFFMLFSSISGEFGNPGQTDYAAGNAFLRNFAIERRERAGRGECRGSTQVIHWPYWADGGMRLDEALITSLEHSLGTLPLPDADALAAFEAIVNEGREDVCLMYGLREQIQTALNDGQTATTDPAEATVDAAPSANLGALQEALRAQLAELTRIEVEEIRFDASFSEYGLDSILLQDFRRKANEIFGLKLTSLQFHKFDSIAELSAHIAAQAVLGVIPATALPPVAPAAEMPPQSSRSTNARGERDVAIVGISMQLPGAENLDEFWALLEAGDFAPQPYPESRWNMLTADMTRGSRRDEYIGLFLEDVAGFDHQMFRVSPREAMLMDPQQRLLLQTVWRAIENAGYGRKEFSARSTSVYLSIGTVDYEEVVRAEPNIDEFTASGLSRYIAANRLSHFFDLRGMSEPIDTACSSVFVAIDRAVDALRKGAVEQAIVAAAQINLSPRRFRQLREKGILSRGGRTLPFDAQADGFVRSEGVGAIVLKPLVAAERDGDHVYAVIKGAGVWHGGHSLGMTAPNTGAHAQAMRIALSQAALSPQQVGYIEAHGTGMSLGDAAEADAIARVFVDDRPQGAPPPVLGAAKSVLGHLEAASGLAALAKAMLALRTGRVPGIAGYIAPNPQAELGGVALGAEARTLPGQSASARYAGLNSYGLGGVSAFVILQGYDHVARGAGTAPMPGLFVLSAQSDSALDVYLQRVTAFLDRAIAAGPEFGFGQMLETYQRRREAMPYRLAVLASSTQELREVLTSACRDGRHPALFRGAAARHAFDTAQTARWVEAADWASVARVWVQGAEVAWPARGLPRHPFPEYPFLGLRTFWAVPRSAQEEKKASPAFEMLAL